MTEWPAVLAWFALSLGTAALGQQLQETCMGESYRAECPKGQVVVMERAEYGRMENGQCITAEYGSVGCENNVIQLLDSWCSGQRQCEFYTMKLLRANTECSKDLMLYLRSSYSCVTVVRREFSYCTSHQNVTLTDVDGFLASQSTDQTGCGSPRVPWIIKAKPGQTIQVTMMDFGVAANRELGVHGCPIHYGYIVEKAVDVNKTICGSDERQVDVYTSRTNVIHIVILPTHSRRGDSRFLLHYQMKGCPDLTPPAHAWYKRKGNQATIGCKVGGRSWDLVCEKDGWKGVVGNCSAQVAASTDSEDIPMFTVLMLSGVIGGTVLMSLVILTIGLCYIKRYGKKRKKKRQKQEKRKERKEETPLEPYLKPTPVAEVQLRDKGHYRPMSYGGASALGLAPGFVETFPCAYNNRSSISTTYRNSSSTMYAQIVDKLPHPDADEMTDFGQPAAPSKNTNTGPARPGHQRQMSLPFGHSRKPSSQSFWHSRQPSLPFGHSRQPSQASSAGYDKVILAQTPGGTRVLIHQAPEVLDALPIQRASPEEVATAGAAAAAAGAQASPARIASQAQPQPPEGDAGGPPELPPRGQKAIVPRPQEKEPVLVPLRPITFDTGPPRTSFVDMDQNAGYYSPTTGHKYYILEQQPLMAPNEQATN